MGKRGPRSKVTPETIEHIKDLYSSGSTHNAICKVVNVSETNIRRILKLHGTPKRTRKVATLLSASEETLMVTFLNSLGFFTGKYRQLREVMEQFAQEANMRCSFTYSWRDGFVRRNRSQLPHHIVKLLSPKLQRTDDMDADLDMYSAQVNPFGFHGLPTDNEGLPIHEHGLFPHIDPLKEPSVWRQKPKITAAERSVRESIKAFVKAGLSREEGFDLLRKLKVPENLLVARPTDVVAAALTDALGGDGTGTVEVTTSSSRSRGYVKKAPVKKTPVQIDLLEKAFLKSQTCGDKRAKRLAKILGLAPVQIIYWFHNTARFKRKKHPTVYETVTESVDEEQHHQQQHEEQEEAEEETTEQEAEHEQQEETAEPSNTELMETEGEPETNGGETEMQEDGGEEVEEGDPEPEEEESEENQDVIQEVGMQNE